jgi:hypothetical protein
MSGHIERAQQTATCDSLSTRDDVWQMANRLELTMHLAAMKAMDRVRILEPRILALAAELEHTDRIVSESELEELSMLGQLLDDLRAELN